MIELICGNSDLPIEGEIGKPLLGSSAKALTSFWGVNARESNANALIGLCQEIDSIAIDNTNDTSRVFTRDR